MTSIENEDLKFAINDLKKTLIAKHDQINNLHQIQMNVMLEQIDQRDQLIDELKEKIESMKENRDKQIQELNDKYTRRIRQLQSGWEGMTAMAKKHDQEKETLNNKIKQYQEQSKQQTNDITSLKEQIEGLKKTAAEKISSERVLFEHVQRHYGCNALWALVDLKNPTTDRGDQLCFSTKKGTNHENLLPEQSATYIDLNDFRFIICDECESKLDQGVFGSSPTCCAKNRWWSLTVLMENMRRSMQETFNANMRRLISHN